MLLLMAVAGPTWATDEVFTLTADLGYDSGTAVEILEGTSMNLTFEQGSNKNNDPKYYSTGDAVRLYGGNTLTITPTAESTIYITKVVFVRGSGDSGKALIASTGKMTGDTWEGCSNGGNITFTADGTTGHVRIAKVTVTYNTDGCPEPTVETTEFMPTFSPEPGEVEAGTVVTITANDDWSIASYLYNSEETTVGEKSCTVTINEDAEIVVNGVYGEETGRATANYTIKAAVPEATFVLTNAKQGYPNRTQVETIRGTDLYLTFAKGSGSTAPTYYTDGDAVRVYGGNTMAVTSSNSDKKVKITKIVITRGEGDNGGKTFSADSGTMTGDTWEGEASSVKFTAASGSGNIRVQTVDVTYTIDDTPAVTDFNPTFSPEPGMVDKNTEVTITANDGWYIYGYYNEDGSVNVMGQQSPSVTITITEDIELTVVGGSYTEGVANQPKVVTYTVNPDSPDYETVQIPYEETLIENKGKFVIEGDDCWSFNSYGAVASKKNVTSWLVSPLVDAEDVTEAITLTFEHQGRFFTTPSEEATLWVREAGGDWEQLAIEYPEAFTGTKWTTFSEVTVDLSDYAGKTFQIGYQYTSTETNYGGWEVKNVNIVAGEVIEKQEAGLSYGGENVTYTATIGEENDFPVLENPNQLEVTYRSTNTDVATIDADGNITLVSAGQTTIFAEFAGNDAFKEGQASYLLVVKEPVIAGTDKYELVTDVTTLAVDDEIIIVGTADEEEFYALSTTQNTNNRAANAVEIEDDGTIIPGNDIQIITLGEGDTGYVFYTGEGYLYAAASDKNWMRTEEKADANANATIDIDDETGDATIVFQGSNTRNHMRFNPNNGNPMFSCYAESSTVKNLPRIYRKVTETQTTYDVTLSKYGLGTFYWSDKAFLLPEGLSAATYTYDEATHKVQPNVVMSEGRVIPAGEAVVLKGEASATYTLTEVDGSNFSCDQMNRLMGLDKEGSVEIPTAVFKYYWLGAKDGVPGFYYGATDGEPFILGAHKAFLPLSEEEAAFATFVLFDGTATAINGIEQAESKATDAVYNLNGQKVNASYKGVVIVNGKKQIRK